MADSDVFGFGLDRRDGTPTQVGQSSSPDTVPLAPIQAPRPSSFAKVGEQETQLSDALGQADLGLDKYFEQKRDQWTLEGQMQYAEGKAEGDVVADGNRYTTAGFMTMKAKTAANAYQQNALDSIEQGDNQLDSGAYQQKLMGQYKDLTKNIAGDDEFTRKLMGSMAGEIFPKLVEQQVKSNNVYKEGQTYDSYVNMLVSESQTYDPTDPDGKELPGKISQLLSPTVSRLSPARHKEAIAAAASQAYQLGSPAIARAIGFTAQNQVQTLDGTAGIPPGGLAYVLNTESSGNRYNPAGTLLTSSKGAQGEMQVMPGTATDPGFGVTPAKDNSPDELARVGRDYLGAMQSKYGNFQLALAAYNDGPTAVDNAMKIAGDPRAGPISMDGFLKTLPAQTQKYVQGWNANSSTPAQVSQITDQAAMVHNMERNGFTPAQITDVIKSSDAYQTKQTSEFNKNRTLTESQIISDTRTNGNLPGALDKIQAAMKSGPYSPEWGKAISEKALEANKEFEKDQGNILELQNALANNTVGYLGGEKQQKALNMKRQEIATLVNGNSKMSSDEKMAAVSDGMSTFLSNNPTVVDNQWQSNIQSALSGNILNKDGTVKKEALQAMQDYNVFKEKVSPEYASKYLGDGYAKNLATMADVFDPGGLSTPQALQAASEALERKRQNPDYTPSVNTEAIGTVINKTVDDLDTSFFGSVLPSRAADWIDIRDSEMAKAKADPSWRTMLTSMAVQHKLAEPNLDDRAAAQQAMNEFKNRGEIVLGTPVMGGPNSSIRQDMGISDDTRRNTVSKAMLMFLHAKGDKMWPSSYNKVQLFGSNSDSLTATDLKSDSLITHPIQAVTGAPSAMSQSLSDAIRGVPDMAKVQYDQQRKGFIVDLWANKEHTVPMNDPKFISSSLLGQWYINKQRGGK